MEEDPKSGDFASLLERIRTEDADAINEFVTIYEPYIRRAIRYRINREGLRAAFDSNDICQSVLGVFLIRLLAGEYVVDSHQALCNLLITIANNKFLMAQRREYAAKRDRRKTLPLELRDPADVKQETPSEIVSHLEIIRHFRGKLTAEERTLYELRQRGLSWEAIADQVQESPMALRQKLSRAARRIALELGFDDE